MATTLHKNISTFGTFTITPGEVTLNLINFENENSFSNNSNVTNVYWEIKALEVLKYGYSQLNEPLMDVIAAVHWQCIAQQGESTIKVNDVQNLQPPASALVFTEFEDIIEENVKNWAKQKFLTKIGKTAAVFNNRIVTRLNKKIYNDNNRFIKFPTSWGY